jgi:hypothetical protein
VISAEPLGLLLCAEDEVPRVGASLLGRFFFGLYNLHAGLDARNMEIGDRC